MVELARRPLRTSVWALILTACGGDPTTISEIDDATADAIDAQHEVDPSGDADQDATADASPDADEDTAADASPDADGTADASPDATTADAADAADGAIADTSPPDAGCGPLVLTGQAHVYVDKSAPAGGNGTLACPFASIAPATKFPIALGSHLTIHVRGAATQVVYAEPSPVLLAYRTTLTSSYPGAPSGPSAVKIVAAGTCAVGNSAPCAVGVSIEARLEGVTVGLPAGTTATHGIVTSSENGARPVVTDVVVSDATGSGIYVQRGAQIGPGVRSERNARHGLEAPLPATASAAPTLYIQEQASVTANPPAPTSFSNVFSDNALDGIRITGAAYVLLRATRAERNGNYGMFVSTTTNGGTVDSIALGATHNGFGGASLQASGSLQIRASSLNAFDDNGFNGLYLASAVSASLGAATASRNGGDGALIFSTMTKPVSITGLVARDNGATFVAQGAGVNVDSTSANVTIRGSTFLGNRLGVRFRQGSANVLDVGRAPTAGNNTFQAATGGAPSAGNNKKAGLCIEGSGAAGSQAAYGDAWSSCPPTQIASTPSGIYACFGLPDAVGVDVAYFPASGGGAPVAAGAMCSIGSP